MERSILTIAFLLCALVVSGQDNPAKDHMRFWDEGPLTWGDFKTESRFSNLKRDSYLSWGMNTVTDTIRTGNLTIRRFTSRTYLDKSETWVRNGCQTDQLLHYHQLGFDYVEMMRRMFQLELDSMFLGGTEQEEIHTLWLRRGEEFSAVYHAFDSICAQGADTARMAQYERLTHETLASLDSTAAILPDVRNWKAPWTISLHPLYLIPTGEARTYIRPSVAIGITFDKWIKRHWFSLEGNLYSGKSLAAYPEGNWAKGQSYNLTNWRATYGYSVINSNYWQLTPRIGAATFGISPLAADKYKARANVVLGDIHTAGPSVGLQAEYKYRRRLQLFPPAGDGCRYSESTIGVCFDATRTFSKSQPDGWYYSVALVWGGQNLIPKKKK